MRISRILLVAALAMGLASQPLVSAQTAPAVADEWACPPCSQACDAVTHAAPGRCPVCGMNLIKKKSVRSVAILLFEGVQIIDYTGPYEVFGQAGFEVLTVSRTGEPLTTAMGMRVVPAHSFATVPRTDLLVVPGGGIHAVEDDAVVVDWIRQQAAPARHVLSVCNGAFLIARAGLLDGLEATTFYGLLDELEDEAPHTRVVRDRRFVDNGKVITSAGLSSGIDASLHVVERVLGRVRAEVIARHLEYDWNPESTFARGALADLNIPSIPPPSGADVKVTASAGDREGWETTYSLSGGPAGEELAEYVDGAITGMAGWTRLAGPGAEGGNARYRLKRKGNEAWDLKVHTAAGSAPGETAQVTMSVQRSTP